MSLGQWWDTSVLPRLTDRALRSPVAQHWRERTCAAATGVVLEVGFGSGRNLPHYPDAVCRVLAVEPADLAWTMAQSRRAEFGRPVERVGHDAAVLDLPDASVDTVISTWTLCTIPDTQGALAQMRRVLRPGGQLVFAEHTISDQRLVAAFERGIQPIWGALAGGCRLDRDIPAEVERAAYRLDNLRTDGFFVHATAHPS